jgi:hypothetical protein
MQRWTAPVFVLLFAGLLALLVFKAMAPTKSAAAVPASSAQTAPSAVASATVQQPPTEEDPTSDSFQPAGIVPAGSASPLPADAPKSVTFGVILVSYRGAEFAAKDARSKPEALEKANTLLAEAQKNFDEAVKKGDRGSTADAGKIPRGILEPAVEYPLFMLKKGEIFGTPIDTPRGYWIVRRNE